MSLTSYATSMKIVGTYSLYRASLMDRNWDILVPTFSLSLACASFVKYSIPRDQNSFVALLLVPCLSSSNSQSCDNFCNRVSKSGKKDDNMEIKCRTKNSYVVMYFCKEAFSDRPFCYLKANCTNKGFQISQM